MPGHHVDERSLCSCGKEKCRNPGKHPRFDQDTLRHGHKDATTDEELIREWWGQWPMANVIVATGAVSGIVALDVDVKPIGPDGRKTIGEWEAEHGQLPTTLRGTTPSHGWRIVYRHPGERIRSTRIGDGVEVKADGGSFVAPPSRNVRGCYKWQDPDAELAELPDWLDAMLIRNDPGRDDRNREQTVNWGVRMHTPAATIARLRDLGCDPQPKPNGEAEAHCPVPGHSGGSGDVHPSLVVYTDGGVYCRAGCPPKDVLAALWPDDKPSGFGLHDIGNGQRLVAEHGRDFRYVEEVEGKPRWFAWDGRRWDPDGEMAVTQWAKKLALTMKEEARVKAQSDNEADQALAKAMARNAVRATSVAGYRAMMTAASSEPGVAARPTVFDAHEDILVCPNGVIEVTDDDRVVFREHRRDDMASRMTRAAYQADADAPLWLEFLERAFPDAGLRRYVQKLLGYSLLGGNPERLFLIGKGAGTNGKGTLAETVLHVLGDYGGPFNLTMFRAKSEAGPRADILDALPKRFLVCNESSPRWKLHGDVIKKLTGGDTETQRYGHRNVMHARTPAFTPWVFTNPYPTVVDADPALWARLRLVPFGQHVDLPVRFRQRMWGTEAAGILRWLVDGLRMYLRERLGDEPPAVVNATMELLENLNHLDAFLAEATVRDEDAWETTATLYEVYSQYCDRDKVDRDLWYSRQAFGQALTDRGYPATEPRRVGDRSEDRKARGHAGIRVLGQGRVVS